MSSGRRRQTGSCASRTSNMTRGTRYSASRLALLEVDDLRVRFPTARGVVNAVNDVSFSIARGERVAVVGESGSGKSVSARSLIGLTPPPGQATGSVRFKGRDLVDCGERTLAAIRGGEIGLILQDASCRARPVEDDRQPGHRGAAPSPRHEPGRGADGRIGAARAGADQRSGAPHRAVQHELSGGMSQRAVIASVIAAQPKLLIADEPTSALDATTAEGILELLTDLSVRREMAVLLITHDLGVVARFAERVVVMYAGRVVEEASVDDLFYRPRHPYTRALLDSVPGASGRRSWRRCPAASRTRRRCRAAAPSEPDAARATRARNACPRPAARRGRGPAVACAWVAPTSSPHPVARDRRGRGGRGRARGCATGPGE